MLQPAFESATALAHAPWSVEKARVLAAEVEAAFRGPDYRTFLAGLYGSRPDRWDDSLKGIDRLRVVVNAMTRMRFVDADGVMDFRVKGEVDSAPRGYLPWFDAPKRASASVPIVCGHWSALGLLIRPDLLALDSGCVWGGRLTAVRLEDRSVTQVSCGVVSGVSSGISPRR